VDLDQKLTRLKQSLQEMKRVAVGYSGGIDSTLLAKVASDTLGKGAVALTAVSASLPTYEQQEAEAIARQIGIQHVLIETDETDDPNYLANTSNRCYFCKNNAFDMFTSYAEQHGFDYVLDGTNADDVEDHRPGRKAARELGVRSPLQETGITKNEIRTLARRFGLPNWDKPAAACLSSRIPYGTEITVEKLGQVGRAELVLKQMGFRQLRVRHHDNLARIEVDQADFQTILNRKDQIVERFKALGYTYVSLDLTGFRSGSMNESLKNNGR